MTAPSIRGYWVNSWGTGGWTTAPVSGDTIYVFTGPADYTGTTIALQNGTDFPAVRQNGNYAQLAKRTATGTSTDNPVPQTAIAIAVYGTDGERYAGNWSATALNAHVGSIGSLNSGNPVGVDDLLVVVTTSMMLYSGTQSYAAQSTISPSGLTQRAVSSVWIDYGSPWGDLGQCTLFTKQLASTTNPGDINCRENPVDAAYGLQAGSSMAILIKGTSPVTSSKVGLGISRY